MNDQITKMIMDCLSPVFMVIAQVILCIIGAYAIKVVSYFARKIGIQVSDKQMEEIETIVSGVVKTLNQRVVTVMKEAATDGKLTDEQKETVYNTAVSVVNGMLSSEQVQLLINKYGDIDEALKVLIETSVVNAKNK